MELNRLSIEDEVEECQAAPVRTLGEVIRDEIARTGLSERQFAVEFGLNKGTLNRVCKSRGKHQARTYAAIARGLRTTMAELNRKRLEPSGSEYREIPLSTSTYTPNEGIHGVHPTTDVHGPSDTADLTEMRHELILAIEQLPTKRALYYLRTIWRELDAMPPGKTKAGDDA